MRQIHPRRREESLTQRVCNYIRREYPGVIFFCDAAGLNLTDNDRVRLIAMRSDDGMTDLCIDHASRGYHGLRLELKDDGVRIIKRDGTLRKAPYTRKYHRGGKLVVKSGDHIAEQAALIRKYRAAGFYSDFAIGFDHVTRLIDWYMCRPENNTLF